MNSPAICGVTPQHCLPQCAPFFFAQVCATDTLHVPAADPPIEEILQITVCLRIRTFKLLPTLIGTKLVVYANKHVELITKSECVKYVSHYCLPFCASILLETSDEHVIAVKAILEDADSVQLGKRCLALSSCILLYPEFAEERIRTADDNSICCNIELNHRLPKSGSRIIGQ